MNPWRRDARPLAIAHRGHSIGAPENTTVAFEFAVGYGAEMIEADINITKDGRLAVIHDPTLDRTTNGSGPVSAVAWSELQGLDAGRWFGPEFSGAHVPAAEALLDFAREAGIFLCLEAKGIDPIEAKAIADGLADLLVERRMLETCCISSYDHDALAAIKRRVPEVQLAPERLPDNVAADPSDACRQATRIGAAVLQNHHAFLTRELVDEVHSGGVAIWAWPTTDHASLVASTLLGVDGLMGDDIRTMTDVLALLRPSPGLATA